MYNRDTQIPTVASPSFTTQINLVDVITDKINTEMRALHTENKLYIGLSPFPVIVTTGLFHV